MKIMYFLSIIIENVALFDYTLPIIMAIFTATFSQYNLFLSEKLRCGNILQFLFKKPKCALICVN